MVVLKQGYRDINIIPDKYNTGCVESDELTVVTDAGLTTSDFIIENYGESVVALKFAYELNQNIPNGYVFENYDFSNITFVALVNGYVAEEKLIIFRNCKFGVIRCTSTDDYQSFQFDNCTINSSAFNNATFNNCKFGGTVKDGINGFHNITVNNCYIQDIWHENSNGAHSDGFQTVGNPDYYDSIDHITFNNCRWEVPYFPVADDGAGGGVNSAIFLQQTSGVENYHDVYINNCIVNGGGHYTVTGGGNGEGNFDEATVAIVNPIFGYAYRTKLYNGGEESQLYSLTENPRMQDSLYVSSVYKDEDNNVHLVVSNDTYVDRKLIVYTNNGMQTIEVPQCYNIAELWDNNDLTKKFEDFPFDIDVNIGVADYVVCFSDFVDENRQIRFVNYTDTDILSPIQPACAGTLHLLARRKALYSIAEYESMNWISGDGVAYFDLGVKLTANHKVEIVFSDDGTTAYKTIYGTRYSANMFSFALRAALTPIHYFGNSTYETFSKISADTKYTYRWDDQIAYINGEAVSDKSTETITYPSYNAFLFAENRAGSPANICTSGLKIHECKIWNGDELLLDLKPVKHQGVCKLKNFVENATQLYYENAASDGAFICG